MNTSNAFAEVIESSISHWISQSWKWNQFPVFGSLVTIETKQRILYGLVYQIQTGSMDPTRYPFPYQKTEEELLAQHPQIFEFLKTTFLCMTVGYEEHNKIEYLVAPEPPRIHSFVQPASKDQSKKFFDQIYFLHIIFGYSAAQLDIDELLLAMIKHQQNLGELTRDQLNQWISMYSMLIGNDYRRLKFFAHRAQNFVQIVPTPLNHKRLI